MPGNFPGKPLFTSPMSDEEWQSIRKKGNLPDTCFFHLENDNVELADQYSTRAYLDRLFENARLRNDESRRSLKNKDLRTALSKIANAAMGSPLADVIGDASLQAKIRAYLRGAVFLLTADTEDEQYLRLAIHIDLTTSVTPELKVLAGVCRHGGAGSHSDFPTGGSHDAGEQVFLSELLNFWRFHLGRPIEGQKWDNPNRKIGREESHLIGFAREAFLIAYSKQINSRAMRQRLFRILGPMDRTENEFKLDWNILSKRLNKFR